MLRGGADDCVPDTSDPVELSARSRPSCAGSRCRSRTCCSTRAPASTPSRTSWANSTGSSSASTTAAAAGSWPWSASPRWPRLEARLGPRVRREVAERLAGVAEKLGGVCDRLGWDDDGRLLMLMPGVDEDTARRSLQQFANTVAGTRFVVADENVRLTPAIGWTPLDRLPRPPPGRGPGPGRGGRVASATGICARSSTRRGCAAAPRGGAVSPWRRAAPCSRRSRPYSSSLLGVRHPVRRSTSRRTSWAGTSGRPPTGWWSAGLIALRGADRAGMPVRARRRHPPRAARTAVPPASAVIAAYLPNEAATIVDTVESFLRLDYPSELEIVLAYNTPHPMPVEETLREMARPIRAWCCCRWRAAPPRRRTSTPRVTRVRGEMVGIFDADHHPAPDAFRHAWHWLSARLRRRPGPLRDPQRRQLLGLQAGGRGVRGHLRRQPPRPDPALHVRRLRRLQRLLAHRSARPHPDARLDAHRGHRLHRARAPTRARKIATDRTLISRELAPTTLKALWNQRSRWAQGWLQVSLKYLWRATALPGLHRSARRRGCSSSSAGVRYSRG